MEYIDLVDHLIHNSVNLQHIQLYPVDTVKNMVLQPIAKSDKWIYGCRCNRCSCGDRFLCKCNDNMLLCYHDYFVQFEYVDSSNEITSQCCNIFEKSISELCRNCYRHLLMIIQEVCNKMTYSRKYNIQIVKNQLSEDFLNRFKDIIAYCFINY